MRLNKFEKVLVTLISIGMLLILCVQLTSCGQSKSGQLYRAKLATADSIIATSKHKYPAVHRCAMVDCEMQGQKWFTSECEEGSDCYLFELTHWTNPELSYEELEEYVFGAMKQDSLKTVIMTEYKIGEYLLVVTDDSVFVRNGSSYKLLASGELE